MFTKQVSRPVDSLDPPSWPPRPSRLSEVEEDLVTGVIRVFVPYGIVGLLGWPQGRIGVFAPHKASSISSKLVEETSTVTQTVIRTEPPSGRIR
jgi:hypothetical protein